MTDIVNFAVDTGDRILQYLIDRSVPGRENLAPAAVIAGRILAPFKPTVTAMSPAGLRVAPVAVVRRDALVIVLANPERGLITQMRVTDGDWGKAAKTTAALGRELAPDDGPWDPSEMMRMAALAVKYSGRIPGSDAVVEETNPAMIDALLLAALTDTARDSLFQQIANLNAAGICPVMVGLFGPQTSCPQTHCLWPVLLPLAPYR